MEFAGEGFFEKASPEKRENSFIHDFRIKMKEKFASYHTTFRIYTWWNQNGKYGECTIFFSLCYAYGFLYLQTLCKWIEKICNLFYFVSLSSLF